MEEIPLGIFPPFVGHVDVQVDSVVGQWSNDAAQNRKNEDVGNRIKYEVCRETSISSQNGEGQRDHPDMMQGCSNNDWVSSGPNNVGSNTEGEKSGSEVREDVKIPKGEHKVSFMASGQHIMIVIVRTKTNEGRKQGQ